MVTATAAAAAARRLLLLNSCSSSSSTVAIAGAAATTAALATVVTASGYYDDDDSRNNRLFSNNATASSTLTTTRCEAAAAAPSATSTKQLPGVNLRSRMTAIGHFSILSETVHNPSICTFVMTLSENKNTGAPFSARDFTNLWKERNMALLHPRFHLRASVTHPGHFESTTTSTTTAAPKNDSDIDPVELHVSEGLPLQIPRRADVLHRIRQMQTQPWSLHEKLWHVSVIPWNNNTHHYNAPMFTTSTTTSTQQPSSSSSRLKQGHQHDSEEGEESVIMFRGHHVLADGASMGAALMDLSDEAQEFRQQIQAFVEHRRLLYKKKFTSYWQRLLQRLKLYFWLCTGSIQALSYQTKLYIYNVFYNTDPWSIIKKKTRVHDAQLLVSSKTRIADVILNDNNEATTTAAADLRSVSYTTMAPLDQVKWIVETLSQKYNQDNNKDSNTKKSKITINDLFVTAITAAIMRQLKEHRQRLDVISSAAVYNKDNESSLLLQKEETKKSNNTTIIPQQDRIHVSVPVHLKGGVVLPGESVGNNIGAFTVQLPGETVATSSTTTAAALTTPSVQRLFAVHEELNKVKQTPAPLVSNMLARLSVACLPRSWTSYLFQKASAGSTCVITNVRGPSSQHMHIKGRTVESIYGFVPLPPGIPIGVVVSSYAGQMLLTVTAESWAIPNADLFLSWVVEEYLVLLKEASRTANKEQQQ